MTLNLDDLEEKARGATKGPWIADIRQRGHRYSKVWSKHNGHGILYKYGAGTPAQSEQDEKNARFIAAANPETILGLVSEARLYRNMREVALANGFESITQAIAEAFKARAALDQGRGGE